MAQRRMGMIGFLLCVCLCLLPCSAQAVSTADAIEPITMERACSLTLSYVSNGAAFADVPVNLYQIAEVSADLQYTLTPPFQTTGLVLNGIQSAEEWNTVRSTLKACILVNDIAADFTGRTDPAGQICFEPLQPGLYLALAGRGEQNGQSGSFAPALIAVPGLGSDGRWQYQVTVASKNEGTPPSEPNDPDEEIQFKVLKLWKGEINRTERPQSIEVEIFRDGVCERTVTLSEDNHWSYTWTAENDSADWVVAERNVPEGYTVTVEERATTFILTNTWSPKEPPPSEPPPEEPPPEEPPSGEYPPEELPPEEPPKEYLPEDAPKTGDTPHILLYTMLMYVSGTVLLLLGLTGRKKRV